LIEGDVFMMSAREIADIWEEIVDAFKDTYEI